MNKKIIFMVVFAFLLLGCIENQETNEDLSAIMEFETGAGAGIQKEMIKDGQKIVLYKDFSIIANEISSNCVLGLDGIDTCKVIFSVNSSSIKSGNSEFNITFSNKRAKLISIKRIEGYKEIIKETPYYEIEYITINDSEAGGETEIRQYVEKTAKDLSYTYDRTVGLSDTDIYSPNKNYYEMVIERPSWTNIDWTLTTNFGQGIMVLDPTISACGYIETPGLYNISAFSTSLNDNCIIINTSDVILDCNGNTIEGDNTQSSQKIFAESGTRNNITIQNCIIDEAGDIGISLGDIYANYNVSLYNISLLNMGNIGFYGSDIYNFDVDNITINGSFATGFYVLDERNLTLNNFNITSGASTNALIIDSDDTVASYTNITNGYIYATAGNGIYASYVQNGYIYNVTIESNGGMSRGIFFAYVDYSIIDECTLSGQGSYSFYIQYSVRNNITNSYFSSTQRVHWCRSNSYMTYANNIFNSTSANNNFVLAGCTYSNVTNNSFYGQKGYESYSTTAYCNFWFNKFYNTVRYVEEDSTTNNWNVSLTSGLYTYNAGNYYADIGGYDFIDSDGSGFYDSGSDYPYNSSQTKWDNNGQDYAPCVEETCTFIEPNAPPEVGLVSPSNESIECNNWVLLNYSVYDVYNDTVNCTLYGDTSATPTAPLQVNNSITNTVSNVSVTYNWTGLTNGTYYWYATCTDGVYTTNSSIYQFEYDSISPIINITAPANDSNNHIDLGETTSIVNVSITELNQDSCWFTNSSGANETFTCGDNYFDYGNFAGTDATINITTYTNDTCGHIGTDTITNVTFDFAEGIIQNFTMPIGPFQTGFLYTDNPTSFYCRDDWCENVTYEYYDCDDSPYFFTPSGATGTVGDMDEDELGTAIADMYWSVANTYNLCLNVSTQNGSVYQSNSSVVVISGGSLTEDQAHCILHGTYINGTNCITGDIYDCLILGIGCYCDMCYHNDSEVIADLVWDETATEHVSYNSFGYWITYIKSTIGAMNSYLSGTINTNILEINTTVNNLNNLSDVEIWNYTTRELTTQDWATLQNATDIINNLTSINTSIMTEIDSINTSIMTEIGDVNTSISNDITSVNNTVLSLNNLNETQVENAVWDADITDHEIVGTFGKILNDVYTYVYDMYMNGIYCLNR